MNPSHVALILVILLLAFSVTGAHAACLVPAGDLDGNGLSNVVDVQCDILLVLSKLAEAGGLVESPLPECLAVSVADADVSCDGDHSVVDVALLIQYSLGEPLHLEIDSDQDGCPDACADNPAQGLMDIHAPDVATVGACVPVRVALTDVLGAPATYTDEVTIDSGSAPLYSDAQCETLQGSDTILASGEPAMVWVRPEVAGLQGVSATGALSTPAHTTVQVWGDSYANDHRAQEALVVYNVNYPGADTIAEYYASARGVPAENLCPVHLAPGTYGTAAELLGARDQVVEDCLCPLAGLEPCGVSDVAAIHELVDINQLVLIKGIPSRLTGTAWGSDKEEPGFDFYLSLVLSQDAGHIFDELTGVSIGKISYPGSSPSAGPGGTTPKWAPEVHGYMPLAKLEAITVDRTLDLIDRTLASEAMGMVGNAFTEGTTATFSMTTLHPGSYPFYYAMSAFDPECSDYLNHSPFVTGAPESSWSHELCRWASTECEVDGCEEGLAPGNANTTVLNPIYGGFFVGGDPRAHVTPINNHSAFNHFSALRSWHVSEESCVELCEDLPTPAEVDTCRDNSLDYFQELNSECVGVAPGFMGGQLRSFTTQYYGFMPYGWTFSGGGNMEKTPPVLVEEGGFQNEAFTDSSYLHFGTYNHEQLDESQCLSEGEMVDCPEHLAVNIHKTISLPEHLPVQGERTFLLRVRYRNQGSKNAKLELRLYMWGELNTGNHGKLLRLTDGKIPTLDMGETHTVWQEAEFVVVASEDVETLIKKVRIQVDGLFVRNVRGFVDLDGIEVIDVETQTPYLTNAVGSFAPAHHHVVHPGGYASDVIDRLGGIAWWGSSSHFADLGYAYGNSATYASRMWMGRTLGESIAIQSARSGIAYGDPLYRSTAVKVYRADGGLMGYTESSKGLELWSDSSGEMAKLWIRVLRGTDNLDTVRWELSRCEASTPVFCAEDEWVSLREGVGAVRDYAVAALDLVPSHQEAWTGVVRVRQWLAGAEDNHLSGFGKLSYYPFPKPPVPECVWDLDDDGWVSSGDTGAILHSIACSADAAIFDLDGDGDVDEADQMVLIPYIVSEASPEEAGCCDYNGDGLIWIDDLDQLLASYCGHPAPENGDLDGDGDVDLDDWQLADDHYGPCPK